MEKIETTYGYRIEEKGQETKYFGGVTDNGLCYKDLKAWETGNGVIYIGEYELKDYREGLVDEDELWTRDRWLNVVTSWFGEDNYPTEFYEYLAECVLHNCDWQDLCTLLTEWEDDIDEDFEAWKSKMCC